MKCSHDATCKADPLLATPYRMGENPFWVQGLDTREVVIEEG